MGKISKTIPKFCRVCGKELIIKKIEPLFYDEQTGRKTVTTHVFCPEKDIETFLKDNKIPEDLLSRTEEQEKLVKGFWKSGLGHTNRTDEKGKLLDKLNN